MAQAFKSYYISANDSPFPDGVSQEIRIDLGASETVEMIFLMNVNLRDSWSFNGKNWKGTFGASTAVYITDNASDDSIA